MKTTKEIYEKAFVKDKLFWINDTDDDKDIICSMDNNPKNNVKWFSESEVKLIVQVEKDFWKDRIEQLQKELKENLEKMGFQHLQIPLIIDEVFNNFKGK